MAQEKRRHESGLDDDIKASRPAAAKGIPRRRIVGRAVALDCCFAASATSDTTEVYTNEMLAGQNAAPDNMSSIDPENPTLRQY